MTQFPIQLDVIVNPGPDVPMDEPGMAHDEQHTLLNEAVKALQRKVGVNGSQDSTSLDYKVANVPRSLVRSFLFIGV